MAVFEITYEFPDVQSSNSLLRIFLKSSSSFSLGGFTLRPSFFDPTLNNQKIDIDSISAINNFFTITNPDSGISSGFSDSGQQSINRENKDGQWVEIARYQFNKLFSEEILVQTDVNDGDFFLSDGSCRV